MADGVNHHPLVCFLTHTNLGDDGAGNAACPERLADEGFGFFPRPEGDIEGSFGRHGFVSLWVVGSIFNTFCGDSFQKLLKTIIKKCGRPEKWFKSY